MARGINKVILIGNLGADPEIRNTAGGLQVANLRLATSESWRDKQSGEQKDRTEWHQVVLFGRLADIAQQYLHKGQQVYIEGRLQTRKWQDKQGNDRYSTEIVGNEMQMLGGRGGGAGDAGGDRGSMGGGSSRGGSEFPDYDSGGYASGGGGSSGGSGGGGGYGSARGGSSSSPSTGSTGGSGGGSSAGVATGGGEREDFDDDIPF